jgi:hypothetical protein
LMLTFYYVFWCFFFQKNEVTCAKLKCNLKTMTISNFYLINNDLMSLMGTLLYLHDDTFLKSSKEFIN